VLRFLKALQRLEELEEQMATLKRDLQGRDMDWLELRARCKRLLDRTEKAARRADEAETVVDSHLSEQSSTAGQSANGRLLSPHQNEIQQQVLRRRAGMR
jgi:hypothetical protein